MACGGRTSLNQLLALLQRVTGRIATPVHREPRPGDVRDSQADISLARQLLGYEPRVTLVEGLEHTVRWYLAEGESCAVEAVVDSRRTTVGT